MVCCVFKGIKIISLDLKETIAEIYDYLYTPIELNDRMILCFGTKDSVVFHNLFQSESVDVILLNNEELKNYKRIKFEPLLLERNTLLIYNDN